MDFRLRVTLWITFCRVSYRLTMSNSLDLEREGAREGEESEMEGKREGATEGEQREKR